jgi:hypothetical protein
MKTKSRRKTPKPKVTVEVRVIDMPSIPGTKDRPLHRPRRRLRPRRKD